MNNERDKFLTEKMGLCWHTSISISCTQSSDYLECSKCGKVLFTTYNKDFSTWEGFGLLWEFAIKQDWCDEFVDYSSIGYISGRDHDSYVADVIKTEIINPDKFADVVYKFLKEKK